MEYKFKEKWDENTNISWRKTSRTQLNKIIESYNNWQIYDNFDKDKARIILAQIEYSKQTIGSRDGGGGYWDELDEMEIFVKEFMIDGDNIKPLSENCVYYYSNQCDCLGKYCQYGIN